MRSQAASLWCTMMRRRTTRAGVTTVQSGSAIPSSAPSMPAPAASRGCSSLVEGYSTSTAATGSAPLGSLGAASCHACDTSEVLNGSFGWVEMPLGYRGSIRCFLADETGLLFDLLW